MNQHQENALRIELEKLRIQNERMRKMATRNGFFTIYFENCKTAKNNLEAFTVTNDEYYKYFGEFRYNSYDAFRQQKNNFLKK